MPTKAGSGARLLKRAGAGQRAIKTWRSIDQATRKSFKATMKQGADWTPEKLKDYIGSARAHRAESGLSPTTGKPKARRTPVSGTTSSSPAKRRPGDAKSNNVGEMRRRREEQATKTREAEAKKHRRDRVSNSVKTMRARRKGYAAAAKGS
jgi:hypothetical protein